jgi:hypothetical protein
VTNETEKNSIKAQTSTRKIIILEKRYTQQHEMEKLEDQTAFFIQKFCQSYPDDDLADMGLDDDDNTIVEETFVPLNLKKKKSGKAIKDNLGRFAKRPRVIDGDEDDKVVGGKKIKKQSDTKKYVAAGNFLLSVRYEIPDAQRNINMVPICFSEEASANGIEYLQACVQCGMMGHRSLENYIKQGKAIDLYFKIFSTKGAGKKKPSASELYKKLAEELRMPGADHANSAWFQGRRALAKISDLLQLNRYGYRCNPSEILKLSPQIERARKLKLVVF